MNIPTPRTSERLNLVITNFLKKYKCFNENDPWQVRESSCGGFGVFANRDIDIGEIIFKDFPIIIGPRASTDSPLICVVCFKKEHLKGCSRQCGLPICSETCQNSETHAKECRIIRNSKKDCNNNINNNNNKYYQSSSELTNGQIKADTSKIFETINITTRLENDHDKLNDGDGEPKISQKLLSTFTPIRALLLDSNDKEVVRSLIAHQSSQHGREIEVLKNEINFSFKDEDEKFLRFVCCVMDANAFEVSTGDEESHISIRGLYPLGSLANHRCYPNATHVFDNEHKMVCKAAVLIPKDSEIFHSYSRIVWGTVTRQYYLKRTKHFLCKCDRCQDPTEFGTYMSAVLCKKCRGNVVPLNPHKVQGRWQCEDCKHCITGADVGHLTKMLGSILNSVRTADFQFMYNFLNGKLGTVVPTTNQVAVELKYKIIWVLGHQPGYKWPDLSIDLLNVKKDLCEDILNLLEKLKTGQCKMRGLLLYELYCCNKEIIKRGDNYLEKPYLDKNELFFNEAQEILQDDVLAPEELKKR